MPETVYVQMAKYRFFMVTFFEITVETPQTTPKHTKPPQTTSKLPKLQCSTSGEEHAHPLGRYTAL